MKRLWMIRWNACSVQGKETDMDYREFMNLLKSYRQQLSFQQFSTLRGQAKSGDIDAAYKGLQKLLRRNAPC